jgi:N-acetylmuramoyl-L-alanine amidase
VVFRPGNQVASWNNLNCWLGFAPRVSKGELYLHPLDLQKNIIPVALSATRLSPVSRTIVIDAGHGGDNHGTRSVFDRRQLEKEYTLDWAKRLKPLLEQRGWRVHMTRVADINLSTTNRVELADAVRADLFISLHFNSSPPNPEQSGLETYCLTPVGLPSSLTREYEDNASHPYSNNAWDLQNFLYATQIHRSLVETTRAVDRGVRRARFMDVLRNQRRPAILLEGGYLSNPREARLIARPDYRQKLAEAVARGLE